VAHPLLDDIDLQGRGLEIGALHNPLIARSEADVLYVDHAPTDEIRAKYADDSTVGAIVDVDVVWDDRPLRDALAEVLGVEEAVDFVVASHVVEHVPNLVGWLEDLAAVLRPGGVVALAVPDKRYCFDARRRESDVAEMIEAHLTERTRPGLAATFDFWTKYDDVDTLALWNGRPPPAEEPLRDREAFDRTVAAAESTSYSDVHCWVFTPESFVTTLARLFDLDLVPSLELRSLRPTAPGSLEFHAVLARLDPALSPAERRERQRRSIDRCRGRSGAPPTLLATPLSPREVRLIAAKRRAVRAVRSVVGRSRARR
jgi:SAM-dependent methyltransferase